MGKKRWKLSMEFMRGNLLLYIGALVSVVVAAFVGFITPMLMKIIIDNILKGDPMTWPKMLIQPFELAGGRQAWLDNLWWCAALLFGVNIISGRFMFTRGLWSAKASERIAKSMRDRLYTHLQHLSYNYHVKAETGDLIQRCTSDVDTVRRFLAMQLVEILRSVAMVVFGLIIMFPLSVKLTLVSTVVFPVIFVFSAVYFKMVMKHFRETDEAEGAMSATLQEGLTGVRVVRAFGRQRFEVERFAQKNDDYRNKSTRLLTLLSRYWSFSDFLSFLQTALTIIVGTVMAVRGEITVGTVLLFSAYVGMLLWPVRQMGRILADMGKAFVSLDRIGEILCQPAEQDGEGEIEAPMDGDIEFDHVSFAYEENQPVLTDVSFRVPHGSTVAILGSTGSGKSTMMHLLQRLYQPQHGVIRIGGTDIQNIRKAWLRQHVGLILQEPFLYSKSLRENVAIVNPDLPDETVHEAARTASVHDVILKFEKGYETPVGERGVTLSGGQKQRVAIARTLMKDNDILVFDDSLSAVDTRTDAAIRRALKEKRKRATTFIISHRISTLSEADFILVLENGQIVQQGTHKELSAQPGLYQRITAIQTALADELQGTTGQSAN